MNSSKEQDSDFILCHCEAVSITPQVDNPISRILVRPDIYHRSQSSLDIPGAPVENRQYQFDVRGLGIFSGNWKEVLKQSQTPERPAELKTRSENPALEWNIASTQPQKAQQGVILLPMLKKFDLQIIAAPAIVLFHPLNPLELVAGHSVEINALTDIFLSPSLGQLRLCSLLLQEALAAQSVLSFKPYQNLNSKSNLSVPVSSDSGVDCSSNNVPQKPEAVIHEVSPAKKWVPFEMLVTGIRKSCFPERSEAEWSCRSVARHTKNAKRIGQKQSKFMKSCKKDTFLSKFKIGSEKELDILEQKKLVKIHEKVENTHFFVPNSKLGLESLKRSPLLCFALWNPI